ncbi:hypothetical protein Xen7305DRAFT_00008170 [Xenococcus sp. PCC 7305]|uniref:ComEA family DNA-binding protein n=1 Tax=Xenococcus sp. PCC 7305 TaxID=102125 RepID=UPI0002AC8169|nr:helix-hairpin-helix domain-containing protein [Xenococcus sp. PCC 7305]ELS01115.1 hypothetical protein Xen7305DRAFT_00008170 [Xenococcus sp. PCC 7305]
MSVVLYKDGDRKDLHEIDVPAWMAAGWSRSPSSIPSDPEEIEEPSQEPEENEEPSSSEGSLLVNLNEASQKEITALSRIGRVGAKAIIEARPIESFDELTEVLPNVDWESLRSQIEV